MSKNRFTLLAAVHVFLIQDGHVLLLRRYNTGYQDGNYSVLAGHLDGGEDVIQAAQREVLEEGGVTVPYDHFSMVGVMHRQSDDERIDFFLTADNWEGEITNMEPHKCDELSWHPINQLPDNTIPYIKRAINNYRNERSFDIVGFQ
ncbi:NUDIX hydrolase [Alkalibacillus almallahensis]|uniref:NUDIX hydrolase n=1 Tax=Alkalibacillus almallahensis TaxID=1379154 RepID=UPI0014242F36|nr:NUDIX domain-containing protein [Alkalibacillus almallahensis]NIK11483.1 ADP-ribose pyrophosphatase YjhB (NUDIX family) [Alkalibacillus almallahensis]